MLTKILSGTILSAKIKQQLQQKIMFYTSQNLRQPALAVILIGEDPASQVYVRNKRLSCEALNIRSISYNLPENTDEKDLLALIDNLNNNDQIDGILVQLPLPTHIDATNVTERIAPDKDVDGFHPYNIGRLCQGIPHLRPCTPYGVMKLLAETKVTLRGKHAVIVGQSKIVGRPMALELLAAKCTVTITHSATVDLQAQVKKADILVVAVGKANFIRGDWIKDGAIIIDVGINRVEGKLVGDVNFEEAQKHAQFITPVPGGVGPMTIAMLMANTVQAYEQHLGLNKIKD